MAIASALAVALLAVGGWIVLRPDVAPVVADGSAAPVASPSSPATDAAPSLVPSATSSAASSSSSDQAEPGPAPDQIVPDPGLVAGTALAALAALPVASSDSTASYDRELFGWRSVDHDRNGCDIRNDVLRRDLTDVAIRAGTNGCKVDSGLLADPYTGSDIQFVVGGGPTNDGGVQIDHVVALANAWASGAGAWDSATMLTFGNDPLNLLAVDGDANQAKKASDASEWLPDNTAFHCEYVARQVAVKQAYSLRVTAQERDAIAAVLATCPDQGLPTAADSATP